jgi:hypothetical protein
MRMNARNQPPLLSHESRVPPSPGRWFENLVWHDDRMICDGWVYETLQHTDAPSNVPGRQAFRLYKPKGLIDQYDAFLRRRPEFVPRRIVELGIWDGGSVALWFQVFQPHKHVAIDLTARGDSDYFRAFVAAQRAETRLKTLWEIDQADEGRLQSILSQEFDGPLDLVIDDASHLYRSTLASLEVLLTRLAPGGLYVIEDWAWEHWPWFQTPDHAWAAEESLTRLVHECVECVGDAGSPIASVTVMNGLVAVERSGVQLPVDRPFRLRERITRRPAYGRRRGVARGPSHHACADAGLPTYIISWRGQHDRAIAIADAVRSGGGDVQIVFSDPDIRLILDTTCPVIRRSDHLFWADKFGACLDRGDANAMLLIQADCDCDDWPGLVRRWRRVLEAVPQCAVWAPHIDGTPYASELTSFARVTADGLWAAAQTDGLVLGLAKPVLDRLRTVRLDDNVYGWGIDQMAVAAAYAGGHAAFVDLSQRVVHRHARGYPTDAAQSQWETFLRQLSPTEQAWHDSLWDFVAANVAVRARRSGVDTWLGGRLVKASGPESVNRLEERLEAARSRLEHLCAGRLAAAKTAAAAADIAHGQ